MITVRSPTDTIFPIFALQSVYFIYAFVPETSGMTLEAIESKMERNSIGHEKEALVSRTVEESHDTKEVNPNYGSTLAV